MRRIRLYCVYALILILQACGWGGGSYYTIEDLERNKVDVKNDIPVESSRKKAIYSYRELLVDEDQEKDSPEVIRRLGDLRLEENEDLQAVDVSSPQVAEKFTTIDINYKETIDLYEYLLDEKSDYQLNDVVLYQLSRAYEAADEREKMLDSLDRLIAKFPNSDYYVEAQFRRGETLFVDKKYKQAEYAYAEVIQLGKDSRFYRHALYKQGWSHFKMLDYDVGLHSFVALIDTMVKEDVDKDIEALTRPEKELLDDSLRALALSYGYLGGAKEISSYFDGYGRRSYEALIYDRLGVQFLEKQRFSDAANTFREFVKHNPFDRQAPDFQIRAIDAFKKGKFPSEVLSAKKQFVENYHINSEYWTHNQIEKVPHVVEFLKTNIIDLAKYYHAVAQKSKKKPDYIEATRWYKAYIASFPKDPHSAHMNFLLADIWYETKEYENAVVEFEKTAYQYQAHAKDSEAGYAALVAFNDWLVATEDANVSSLIKSRQIDSTFKFANKFPLHPEAPVALTKAAEDLFSIKDYKRAIEASSLLVENFADSDVKLRKSAWTVKAHSSFELKDFSDSEVSYQQAILLVNKDVKERKKLEEKLAASIYKQGEASQLAGETDAAVNHYLRVGQIVPDSDIRPTAQYDAAALLLKSEQWSRAATVLEDFRGRFPDHKEQSSITHKLALVYEKDQRNLLAAQEYERISLDDSNDKETQRTSSLVAADLYAKEKDDYRAIEIYKTYIKRFPKPYEASLEVRQSLVDLYSSRQEDKLVKQWRQDIIKSEATAGTASTDRMKFIAANASLQLAIPKYTIFNASRLKIPLKTSLKVKKKLMERALAAFELAGAYKVEEVTTAATYYSGLIYYDFSRALMQSDRPRGLSEEELAQYEFLLEEQAFPFEEQAIDLFELNARRTADGVYNQWIRESLRELGELVPARYARTEKSESYVETIY
ncbi:MAG: tetratricopeptide repeat protein [Gammaproteobacteria bacterium]|nr:tetratricopeptide repeat protein [Gammaproteobacteria bacterium]